jgi:2-keto-4-pentenoate hydratase/2-oxohepta-3-ene-1,7-dioic acid hydratase in catechol pathway
MKLLRYGPPGQERPGLLDASGVIRDLSAVVPDLAGDALRPAALARLRQLNPVDLPKVDGQPRLGPCVGRVGKFICVGLNYSDHAKESNMALPPEPIIFMKATSALNHVAGYCIVNDLSERAFQLEMSGQWVKGKSADTFGPIGPWLVTPDEIGDWQALDMWLDVDGHRYQNGSTKTMAFGVPYLISYLSRFMSLQPGDVISTGTPPGVGLGQKPPVYLRAGQQMRLGITGLGEQHQHVVASS